MQFMQSKVDIGSTEVYIWTSEHFLSLLSKKGYFIVKESISFKIITLKEYF